MSRVAGTSNERLCGSQLSESWFGLTIHSILSCRQRRVLALIFNNHVAKTWAMSWILLVSYPYQAINLG